VKELGRATGGAGGQVTLLDEPDGKPPRDGIKRAPDTGYTTAHNENIELFGGKPFPILGALRWVQ